VKYIPDLSDVISVIGLSLLGYGLFLFLPWVSYAVCGSLLIIAGVRIGANESPQENGGEG
jgi:hypothetical protein